MQAYTVLLLSIKKFQFPFRQRSITVNTQPSLFNVFDTKIRFRTTNSKKQTMKPSQIKGKQ
jgi:hypothetical protein